MPSQRQSSKSRTKKGRFNPYRYPSASPELTGQSYNTYLSLPTDVEQQGNNSFFCFLAEGQKLYNTDRQAFFDRFAVEALYPEGVKTPHINIPTIVAAAWNKLSQTEKQPYKDMAHARKTEDKPHPGVKIVGRRKGKKKSSQDSEATSTTPALSFTNSAPTLSPKAELTPSSTPPLSWSISTDLINGSLVPEYFGPGINGLSDTQNSHSNDSAILPSLTAGSSFTFPADGGVSLTGLEPSSDEQADVDFSTLPPLLDGPASDFNHEYQDNGWSDCPMTFELPLDTYYTLNYPTNSSSGLYPLAFETSYEYDGVTSSSYDGRFNTFSSAFDTYSHSQAGPSNSSHSTSSTGSADDYNEFFNSHMDPAGFLPLYPTTHSSTNPYPYPYSSSGSSSESNPAPGSNSNSDNGGWTPPSRTPIHDELAYALEATHLQEPLGPGSGHQSNFGDVGQVPNPGTSGDECPAPNSNLNDIPASADGWQEDVIYN